MGLEVQKLYWGKCCAGQRRGSRSRQGEASDFHLCSTLWKKRGKGRGLDRKNMRASRGLRRQWPGWGSVSSRSYHWEKAAPVPAMLSHWLETAGGSVASALMWFRIWRNGSCGPCSRISEPRMFVAATWDLWTRGGDWQDLQRST